MYGDLYPALEYDTEEFHCPKNPLCSPCSFLPPPNSLEATDHITVCVVLSFPEGRRVRIAHHIACSDWLLPPSNMRLNFPQVFLRQIAHFCLLPIIFHCLDSIVWTSWLCASFCKYEESCYTHWWIGFCVDISFHLFG